MEMNKIFYMRCLTAGVSFLSFAGAMAEQEETSPHGFVHPYLFVTFKGEQTPLTEQIYFAITRDGREWTALNKGEPVLITEIGEKGARDPFLLRSHDGKKFYLIATDLSWNRDRNVGRSIRAGSRSILVWESTDLVNWSAPRLAKVAPDDAGCTWAPEAVYDEETGDYLVFWASTTKRDNFAKHRIWATRTKDFVTFGEPFLFIEKPTAVIDTTIVRDGRSYYRFTKDEKFKAITFETSPKLMGPWTDVPGFSLDKLLGHEGPACYIVEPASPSKPATWCLILDHYAKGLGYQPFVTHDLASGQFTPGKGFTFPFKFRHGSVLALTAGEFQRLETAYGRPSVDPADPSRPLSWTNPIVPQRADPQVLLHSDGWYYLAATVPEYDRIELRRARTLGGLSAAEPKVIWRKHERGEMGAHIWAPEIHFIDGKWYVYFTAGESHKIWNIRPYALECSGPDPLANDWIERGRIRLGWESFSLDATTFAHRGVRYFVWTQVENGVKGTNIYIARMDTPLSITGKITLLARPDREWERRGPWVCEAPAVLIKNGRVFITYSASATDANYCIGLLHADENADLLDPASWTKLPEPVLKSDPAASVFGPGHNSFTTTPDGKTDLLVYHARNYEKIQGNSLYNPDRATRAQIIRWRADGFPDFSPPIPDGPHAR